QLNAGEALVCDRQGYVVEGLSSNLVIEHNQQLITPGPHPAAVSGVGLAWLKQQLGDLLIERSFHWDELQPSDAIWVINSVAGIRSVTRLDGQARLGSSHLDDPIQRWKQLFGFV
ncbi:MAG: aminotransferase class IV, partial [Pseudomonadota bacterium]